MKISLVLGSGGARGYAHIGVLQEIESRGHEVVAISGRRLGHWSAAPMRRGGCRMPPTSPSRCHGPTCGCSTPLGAPGLIKGDRGWGCAG